MMRATVLALLLLFSVGWARADDMQCGANQGEGRWTAACFEGDGSTRRVKPQFRARIVPNKFGMAVIVLHEPFEVVAVDRSGRVVVPGIASAGDRDYPEAEQGVGRFYSGKKCGYFKSGTFKVLVPAEYDACHPFFEGRAAACKECVRYCTEEGCQDSTFVGGTAYVFNAGGRILKQYALPKLEDACGKPGIDRIGKVDGVHPLLKCKEDPNSPFKM
jgi:hypothetical protein